MSNKSTFKKFGSGAAGVSEDQMQEFKDVLGGKKDIPEPAVEPPVQADPQAPHPLEERVDSLEKELKEAKEKGLRLMADFENSKRRLEREKDEVIKYANEKVLKEFFPVFDSLEGTLQHLGNEATSPLADGLRLVLKQFLTVLEKAGVEIVSGENAPFDPHKQEAISSVASPNHKGGEVVSVLRKGFALNGRLIRPALVTVAEASSEPSIH